MIEASSDEHQRIENCDVAGAEGRRYDKGVLSCPAGSRVRGKSGKF